MEAGTARARQVGSISRRVDSPSRAGAGGAGRRDFLGLRGAHRSGGLGVPCQRNPCTHLNRWNAGVAMPARVCDLPRRVSKSVSLARSGGRDSLRVGVHREERMDFGRIGGRAGWGVFF